MEFNTPQHSTNSAAFSEPRFWKHVGVIIFIKIILLTLLWYAFFGPGHEMKPDANALQHQLTGAP